MQATATDQLTYFASGTNHPGELDALATLGIHVGFTISKVMRKTPFSVDLDLVQVIARHPSLKVFVDSGAFSEVEFPIKGGPPVVTRPASLPEWSRRFAAYRVFAEALGSRLYAVAPDQVGQQEVTLQRQELFRDAMQAVSDAGAHLVVPVQRGPVPLSTFWAAEQEVLALPRLIPGLPMRKNATTPAQVAAFVREVDPPAIHLLGKGPRSRGFDGLCDMLWEAKPALHIYCDSVAVRSSAMVGRHPGARYSAEQHRLVREDLIDRDEVMDPTEVYENLDAWPLRVWQELGRRLGLPGGAGFDAAADRKAWLEAYYADPLFYLDPLIDAEIMGLAWREQSKARLVSWKKKRALLNVLSGTYGEDLRDYQLRIIEQIQLLEAAADHPGAPWTEQARRLLTWAQGWLAWVDSGPAGPPPQLPPTASRWTLRADLAWLAVGYLLVQAGGNEQALGEVREFWLETYPG